MAISIQLLRTGFVNAATSPQLIQLIYSPSVGDALTGKPARAAVVSSMRFTNKSGTAATLAAWFQKRPSAPAKFGIFDPETARAILPVDKSMNASAMVFDEDEITMGPGDELYLKCNEGARIDYVLCGLERDVP